MKYDTYGLVNGKKKKTNLIIQIQPVPKSFGRRI
jgi:hypothetical protein